MRAAILALSTAAFVLAACGQSTDAHEGEDHAGASAPVAVAATVSASGLSSASAEPVDLAVAEAGEYATDPEHRYITFSYLHQGYSRPAVRWDNWEGTLNWNPENPADSSVNVVIEADSVDSGVDRFDEHLRSADFFDVETYPEITFESTSIAKTGPNSGAITGNLTIKDTTRPVTLDAVINRAAYDEGGKQHKIGFSARTRVKRSDFGVDLYVPFVGDDVDIIIEAEFQKSAE